MKKLFSVIITALLIISVVPLGAFAAAGDKTFYVGDAVVTAAEAVRDVKPVWRPDAYNTFAGRNKLR